MRPEITTIIFSKNRACQLELLLRSLNLPATVIYTFDPTFASGYDKLIKMYPDVRFVLETDFKAQLLELLAKSPEEYAMFLVDDDVMIEPFEEKNYSEFEEFKKNKAILCLSLRLAPHYEEAPDFQDNNTWNWRGLKHDWGYPMSVSAHIFRKQDILPIMIGGSFNMPNDLEVLLRKNPPTRPLMMCVDKPNIINIPANLVQTKYRPNRFKNMGVSAEEINDKFLSGHRISLNDIMGKARYSRSCFLMADYQYEIYLKNEKANRSNN